MSTTLDTAILPVVGVALFSGISIAHYPNAILPIVNPRLYGYLAVVLGAVGVNRSIFCVNPDDENNFAHDLRNYPLSQEYLVKETAHGTGGSLRKVETAIQADEYTR